MSSVPPTPPSGGAPPPVPPYDPKTQWRAYREQQRAAERAQREAWKAQRHAWKADLYGPRVPSAVGPILLIGVGVVALLLLTGHIPASAFWSWYGHWWPLLLIGAGLALLGEWALDLRRALPVRRGGSYVGILILLALLGFGAAGWNNYWGPWRAQWAHQNNGFFSVFGLPEHDSNQATLSAKIAPGTPVEIDNPRGDVSVTAGDGSTLVVQAREMAFTNSDTDARKIFDAEAAHLTIRGKMALVKAGSSSSGRVNLSVTVPRDARVAVNSGQGDVTASGLGAGISIVANGDVQLNTITGPAEAHFSQGSHDFSAYGLQGDLTVGGNLDDMTLSGIKGKVAQNGEIFGDVHMENIAGPIHLHTSVTDLEVAGLPDDLTLDSDTLQVNGAQGKVHVITRSKDIDLNQIYGDTYAEDRDGTISVEPAGIYDVEARNSKGDVELTLTPNASAMVSARTHNGDIISDFATPSAEGEDKSVTFRIGSGTARIELSADNGDVHIKKGPAFPAAPPAGAAAPVQDLKARHLKANRPLPALPVTQ
ncbi:MAG: DUF4097 family beta strand repeat-containing protein [Terracidiphilus sp.]